MTREDMIQSGMNIDATHAVFCIFPDKAKHTQVLYVLPGDKLTDAVASCTRTGAMIEVVNLKEKK